MKNKENTVKELTLIVLCKGCHRLIRIAYNTNGKPLSLEEIKRNALLIHNNFERCKQHDMVVTNMPL